MNTFLKTNRILIFIVLAITILLLIILAWWGLVRDSEEQTAAEQSEELIEVPNLPPEQWTRKIYTEKDSQGNQLVKNVFDKYQITVPPKWDVADTATANGGLKIVSSIFEGREVGTEIETDEGLIFTINTLKNPQELGTLDWLSNSNKAKTFFGQSVFEKAEHSIEDAFRTERAPIGHDAKYREEEIDDAVLIQYVFTSKERVYILSCEAFGESFVEIGQKCEDAVQTFTILE